MTTTKQRQSLAAAGLALAAAVAWGAQARAAPYTFTTIDVAGADSRGTTITGINDSGQVVGSFFPDVFEREGFVITAGNVNAIGAFVSQFNNLKTINNLGEVAGMSSGGGAVVGFFASPPFLLPGTPSSAIPSSGSINGINDLGQAVGIYENQGGTYIPFVATPGQALLTLIGPGRSDVPNAINNAGQIAGSYVDANGVGQGFVDTNGSFATISIPGAASTSVTGINNVGSITGIYSLNGQDHGFVETGNIFTPIDEANATFTDAYGINDLGQVAGTYQDAAGTHGFVATPVAVPEPASATVLAAGMVALGCTLARRRRVTR